MASEGPAGSARRCGALSSPLRPASVLSPSVGAAAPAISRGDIRAVSEFYQASGQIVGVPANFSQIRYLPIDAIGMLMPPIVGGGVMMPPIVGGGVRDGEYCLILDNRAPGGFRFAPYDPSWDTIQSVLSGTLLMDFYNDCIKSLTDFVTSQFTASPAEANLPVGPTQKRITSFLNLGIQYVHPDTGSYVYLSGDQKTPTADQEDTILRNFYNELRKRLQSSTFCAMFDGARQFPTYPYTGLNVATVFGKGFKTRMRVDPTGTRAYTLGVDNVIHVYDLQQQRMDSELPFPASAGAVVQDVAFSPDGKQVYAVANLNNQDTVFGIADVNGLVHTWRKQTTVICDTILTTLGTRKSDGSLYAIGVGKGLYVIDPANVNATPTPLYPFAAFGHLVIDDVTGFGYASNSSKGPASGVFDQVLQLNLTKGSTSAIPYSLGAFQGTAGESGILK